jgi:hypothetical protein
MPIRRRARAMGSTTELRAVRADTRKIFAMAALTITAFSARAGFGPRGRTFPGDPKGGAVTSRVGVVYGVLRVWDRRANVR